MDPFKVFVAWGYNLLFNWAEPSSYKLSELLELRAPYPSCIVDASNAPGNAQIIPATNFLIKGWSFILNNRGDPYNINKKLGINIDIVAIREVTIGVILGISILFYLFPKFLGEAEKIEHNVIEDIETNHKMI